MRGEQQILPTERIRGFIESRDAQVVHERHEGFDPQSGPWGSNRVGFRIGDRVFWTGCAGSHGGGQSYNLDAALAAEIVRRWNAGGINGD